MPPGRRAPDEPMTYWLDSDGGRVLIGPASVLVGRSPDCDIVVSDARMSRHHALFRTTDDGVEVLSFGRQPVTVNGEARVAPTALRTGDRVECVGHTFEIVETSPSQAPDPDVLWGVERSPGALFRITQNPFRVGGAGEDHLIFVGWPPTVLLLHRVGNGLALEAVREGVTSGAALAPGECVHLEAGARIAYGGQTLRVLALPRDPTTVTATTATDDLPTSAELRFMPRGGRLTLRFGARDFSVYLADRRCDLVACLLQPPPPFAPGDVIPDDTLIDRIWSERVQGRVELNTLIFRTRKDLIKADIDGAGLIAREGGGARLRLMPGAAVRVVTA
jgi:hypothetical protein